MSDYNITLEKVKRDWLKVPHDRDDTKIEFLIKVALDDIQDCIDRKFDDQTTWGEEPLVLENGSLAPRLEAAVWHVVDDLYRNNSTQFDQQQFENKTFTRLFQPYRKMGV